MDLERKWFVVEYDRHKFKLNKITEYAEPEQRQEAWNYLRELEESQADELNHFIKTGIPLRMEYVLLLADSEDALRVTHPNYFYGPDIPHAEAEAEVNAIIARRREKRRAAAAAEAAAANP